MSQDPGTKTEIAENDMREKTSAEILLQLTEKTKHIREYLLQSVLGQNHAVNTFVSGCFQAELMAFTDKERVRPRATFLFAGPPGVGKTYLAQKAAEALELPFRRFDMSEFGDSQALSLPEEFLDGSKKAIRRNKLITGVLYYSKDMETFATGLKRIKDLCDESGCKVEFRMEQEDFVVIFYRNLRDEWNKQSGLNENASDGYSSELPRDYQETTKTTAMRIKDIMREEPTVSAAEIAKKIGLTLSGVQYHIKRMKASGEIKRDGADFGGTWIVVE